MNKNNIVHQSILLPSDIVYYMLVGLCLVRIYFNISFFLLLETKMLLLRSQPLKMKSGLNLGNLNMAHFRRLNGSFIFKGDIFRSCFILGQGAEQSSLSRCKKPLLNSNTSRRELNPTYFSSSSVFRQDDIDLDKFIKSRRSRHSSFINKPSPISCNDSEAGIPREPSSPGLSPEEKEKRLKMMLSRKRRFLSPTLRIKELTGEKDPKEQ